MTFESAVYTDVTLDESIDQRDGFNFQAVSEGIDGTDLNTIRGQLLHHVSMSWHPDRNPLDHPATATYITQHGRYYLARGVSTGQTRSGRPGNQLTHALVTRDERDLEPYRPAQLFAASVWRTTKAQGQELTPVFAPLKIDPSFEAEALLEAIREDPWWLQTLPVLLSMLEQAVREPTSKVVVVHKDMDTVMRWFSVGTLLLSAKDAASLEIRVFAAEPFKIRAQLVGVHPDLLSGSLDGAFLIDLENRRVSDIEITDTALTIADWVRRLDPFDALEVIAVAQRWIPFLGVERGAAGAEMVTGTRAVPVGHEEWVLGVSLIEGLAEAGLVDDLAAYVDEFSSSVASYRLRTKAEFTQSARSTRYAAGIGIEGLSEAILLPTLESLAAQPEYSRAWAEQILADGPWEWSSSADGQIAGLLSEVLTAAPADALPALLQVAVPFQSLLPGEQAATVLRRAADYVLEHPVSGIRSWCGSGRLLRALRRDLVGAMGLPDRADSTWQQLISGDWDDLATRPDEPPSASHAAFASWLAAARIARLPNADRTLALRACVGEEVPSAHTWKFALEGSALPRDIELYATWVRVSGVDSTLQLMLDQKLSSILRQDPRTARARDVRAWVPLARALAETAPEATRYFRLVDSLEALAESTPGAMGSLRAARRSALDRFSRRDKRRGKA